MPNQMRAQLGALAVAFILAIGVSTASAGHFSINRTTFRATWNPLAFRAGSTEIGRCQVTLEGSFHEATTEKVLGSLMGYVTRAIRGTCERGSATFLNESLPWHLTYEGFTGRLPTEIGSIRVLLIGVAFRISEGIVNCLARTETGHPARGEISIIRELGGELKANTLSAEEGAQIPCGIANGSFSGTGPVTVLGGSERILIRLI